MKKLNINTLPIVIFYVLLALFFAYVLITQKILPNEESFEFTQMETLKDGWILTTERGNEEISLPGKFDIKEGEVVSISKALPWDMKDYNTLLIWNTGKDFKVYIDDELIFTYGEKDIYKIGKDRPFIYVWVTLPDDVGGKQLRIEYKMIRTNDNFLGKVFLGERASVIVSLIAPHEFEIVIAIVVFIMSLGCIIGGILLQKNVMREEPLIYMGTAAGLTSLWILANSKIRQFIFHNVSSIRNVAFLVVPFLPVAFLFFLDVSQKRRFHKIYLILQGICLTELIVVFILHVTNIFGLSETFNISLAIAGITVLVCLVTILSDFINKRIKNYLWSSIGILLFGFFTIAQIISYKFFYDIETTSINLLTGLFVLVSFSVLNATSGVSRIRKEKRDAENLVKTVSSEAMETIARAVDAKDKYTAMHSIRVSAYAIELAKRIGMSEAEVDKLRFGALLHDIGKIGIPDAVLNKPGKLTDEEYNLIKTHTTIGGDIMKQMTSVPGADNIARYHHERYDGKGYPEGLSGEKIPKEARIVCIADSYDAMNSRRVYRQSLTKEIIREELVKGKGTQFDSFMLDIFLDMFDSGALDEIESNIQQ